MNTDPLPENHGPKPSRAPAREASLRHLGGSIGLLGMPNSGKTEFVLTAGERGSPSPKECPGWIVEALGRDVKKHNLQYTKLLAKTPAGSLKFAPLFRVSRRGFGLVRSYDVDAPDPGGELTKMIANQQTPIGEQVETLHQYEDYLVGCVGLVCAIDPFGFQEEDGRDGPERPDAAARAASASVLALTTINQKRRRRLFGLLSAGPFPVSIMLTKLDEANRLGHSTVRMRASRSLVARYLDPRDPTPDWIARTGDYVSFEVNDALSDADYAGDLEFAERLAWDFLNVHTPAIAGIISSINRSRQLSARPYLITSYGCEATETGVRPGMQDRRPKRQFDPIMSVLHRDYRRRVRIRHAQLLSVALLLVLIAYVFGPLSPRIVGWGADQLTGRGELALAESLLRFVEGYPVFPLLHAQAPELLAPLADANRNIVERTLKVSDDSDHRTRVTSTAARVVKWSSDQARASEWLNGLVLADFELLSSDQRFTRLANMAGSIAPKEALITKIDEVLGDQVLRVRSGVEAYFADGVLESDVDRFRQVASDAGSRLQAIEKFALQVSKGTAFISGHAPDRPTTNIGLAHLASVRAGQALVAVLQESLDSRPSRADAVAGVVDSLHTATRIAASSGRTSAVADVAAALHLLGNWAMPALDPAPTAKAVRGSWSDVQLSLHNLERIAGDVPSVAPLARLRVSALRLELRREFRRYDDADPAVSDLDADGWMNFASAAETCAKLLGEDDHEAAHLRELGVVIRARHAFAAPRSIPDDDLVAELERIRTASLERSMPLSVPVSGQTLRWDLTRSVLDHRKALGGLVLGRLADELREGSDVSRVKTLTAVLFAVQDTAPALSEIANAVDALLRQTPGRSFPDLVPVCVEDQPPSDAVSAVLDAIARPTSPRRTLADSLGVYNEINRQAASATLPAVAERLELLADKLLASIDLGTESGTSVASDLLKLADFATGDIRHADLVHTLFAESIKPSPKPQELAEYAGRFAKQLVNWGRHDEVSRLLHEQATSVLDSILTSGATGDESWRRRLRDAATAAKDKTFLEAEDALEAHLERVRALGMVFVAPLGVAPFWIAQTELTYGAAKSRARSPAFLETCRNRGDDPEAVLRNDLLYHEASDEAKQAGVRLPSADEWLSIWRIAAAETPSSPTNTTNAKLEFEAVTKARLISIGDMASMPPRKELVIGLRRGLSEWAIDLKSSSAILLGGSFLADAKSDGRPAQLESTAAGVRFAADAVPELFSKYVRRGSQPASRSSP